MGHLILHAGNPEIIFFCRNEQDIRLPGRILFHESAGKNPQNGTG